MRSHVAARTALLVVFGLAGAAGLSALDGARAQTGGAGASPRAPRESAEARPALARASTAAIPKGQTTIRLLLHNKSEGKQKVPTKWDATVSVQGGRLSGVEILGQPPSAQVTADGWNLTTVRAIARQKTQKQKGQENMPVLDATVMLSLAGASPNTKVDVNTAQGAFSFLLKDVPFGKPVPALNGMVELSRSPNTARILSAPTEDDFPAAAYGADGKLFVAYSAFTHGKGFEARRPIESDPKDFSYLKTPAGGDQVFLMRLDGDKWSERMPVTEAGQDVYRLATAVDGSGRAWVVWSANKDENWDLYARTLEGETWSKTLRLTKDPGPDLFPVAATDASGRVWIAWQAFRGESVAATGTGARANANILAMRQEATGFGEPMAVSDDPADEWDPAIAAASNGDVAIAWDTYAKGDYDVAARVWSKGQFGDSISIAASLKGESRAAATYDNQGRLWVAYEISPEKWGKDWGKEAKGGVPLYGARTVGVRVWAGGRLLEPAGEPERAFLPERREFREKQPADMKLAAPRIGVDNAGRVWLAVRQGVPNARAGVGTVWVENMACYLGDRWSDAIFCPGTDGLLDSRPALLARPEGGVALVSATDLRLAQASMGARGRAAAPAKGLKAQTAVETQSPPWPDPANSELSMAEIPDDSLAPVVEATLKPVADAAPAAMPAEAKSEAEAIARMRDERITVGGETLRILRGEFHRHTEISGDGGGDGMLSDTWRYAHDMANHDWMGNGDHDNGGGREYSWWLVQKTTSAYRVPSVFEPMYSYERSCGYPDGHRNVVFPARGIRPLPRLQGGSGKAMDDRPDAPRPQTPDTQMLYRYLRQLGGICASHTSATNMGTDWRDNDPTVEPVVEIYQGDRQNYEMPGAPRSNTAKDSAGGWRPMGFVSLALKKGYRLGFQSSSDHVSTHISYCDVWAKDLSREAIFDAMKRRHVYGATDNIVAEFRCGEHFMGDEFISSQKPSFKIRIVGTKPVAKVHIVKDGEYAYETAPQKQEVELEWTDENVQPGKTSYYYARGEQADGQLVWMSPMWIAYKP